MSETHTLEFWRSAEIPTFGAAHYWVEPTSKVRGKCQGMVRSGGVGGVSEEKREVRTGLAAGCFRCHTDILSSSQNGKLMNL